MEFKNCKVFIYPNLQEDSIKQVDFIDTQEKKISFKYPFSIKENPVEYENFFKNISRKINVRTRYEFDQIKSEYL